MGSDHSGVWSLPPDFNTLIHIGKRPVFDTEGQPINILLCTSVISVGPDNRKICAWDGIDIEEHKPQEGASTRGTPDRRRETKRLVAKYNLPQGYIIPYFGIWREDDIITKRNLPYLVGETVQEKGHGILDGDPKLLADYLLPVHFSPCSLMDEATPPAEINVTLYDTDTFRSGLFLSQFLNGSTRDIYPYWQYFQFLYYGATNREIRAGETLYTNYEYPDRRRLPYYVGKPKRPPPSQYCRVGYSEAQSNKRARREASASNAAVARVALGPREILEASMTKEGGSLEEDDIASSGESTGEEEEWVEDGTGAEVGAIVAKTGATGVEKVTTKTTTFTFVRPSTPSTHIVTVKDYDYLALEYFGKVVSDLSAEEVAEFGPLIGAKGGIWPPKVTSVAIQQVIMYRYVQEDKFRTLFRGGETLIPRLEGLAQLPAGRVPRQLSDDVSTALQGMVVPPRANGGARFANPASTKGDLIDYWSLNAVKFCNLYRQFYLKLHPELETQVPQVASSSTSSS